MNETTSEAATPPPSNPAAAPPRRAPYWMQILLIVSLAINLAAGGYAIARVVGGPRFVSAGPAASLMDARKLLRTLPREMRNTLRDELTDRHHDELMDHRARWNDARQALAKSLARPDVSDDEIRRAYRELGQSEADAAMRLREILAELTLRTPAKARAVFADRMGHDHRHFRSWRRHDRDGN